MNTTNVNQQYELENKTQFHIRCRPGDVGEYVLLPGDPGRIDLIAEHLDNVKEIAYSREYRTITGYYNGLKVSATSTGIGCPSAAIAVEELVKIGAKYLVRVGSTAGISEDVKDGDYIIPTGVVALDGANQIYLNGDYYPAVSDFDLNLAIYNSARENKVNFHTGVVLVHDSFYAESDEFLKKWHDRNVLSVEMESSILFILGALRKVHTASFHLAGGNLISKEKHTRSEEETEQSRFLQHKVVLDAFLSINNQRSKILVA